MEKRSSNFMVSPCRRCLNSTSFAHASRQYQLPSSAFAEVPRVLGCGDWVHKRMEAGWAKLEEC